MSPAYSLFFLPSFVLLGTREDVSQNAEASSRNSVEKQVVN